MNDLLTYARTIAAEGAPIVRQFYGNARVSEKSDTSPVTEADTAIHNFLLERLASTKIPILSEEDSHHLSLPYPERLWIIDPLDGTKGFINMTGDFAIMIGLIENGRPVLGVVHCPVDDTVYFATRDGGSWISENGVTSRLQVSSRVQSDLRGLLSVNHSAPYIVELGERLNIKERVSVGSIGIKAGYIARDRADFYVTRGELGEWDVCAPEIILSEAGGIVTDTEGNPLLYGNANARIAHGLVFSNGHCHTEVIRELATLT